MVGTWILRPRIYRMLFNIGYRVGASDEWGVLDDWILYRLKWVQEQARKSGWDEVAIEEAVMDGLVKGRQGAHKA